MVVLPELETKQLGKTLLNVYKLVKDALFCLKKTGLPKRIARKQQRFANRKDLRDSDLFKVLR